MPAKIVNTVSTVLRMEGSVGFVNSRVLNFIIDYKVRKVMAITIR